MAFFAKAYADTEMKCDNCRKVGASANPIFVFSEASGRGHAREYHEIRLHKLCLEKIMEKTEVR